MTTTGPTGVEMEALTAAAVAALTVYDMTKALDKGIEIQELYLVEKTGGKSGDYKRRRVIRVAILTISDSAVAGTREDRSGPAVAEKAQAWAGRLWPGKCLKMRRKRSPRACPSDRSRTADVVLTTGGTAWALAM